MKKDGTKTIVALTRPGQEYLYNTKSAHEVSAAAADRICKALNDNKIGLLTGHVWRVYMIDKYMPAWAYAEEQKYYINRGYLKERHPRAIEQLGA